MYQYQGYDLMTGLYILIGLVWLAGLLIGLGLGYRLAWRHARVHREYAQREPVTEPTEAWIGKLEQEINER